MAMGFMFWTAAACPCFIGQEWDPATNRLRGALPFNDPCQCTSVELGGVNVIRPQRPFRASYFDAPLQLPEIRMRLNCSVYVCSDEEPLGMQDGRIKDEQITASSYYQNKLNHGPAKARLDTQAYASAWCYDRHRETDPDHPWIQVEFNSEVYVTGLVTQARGGDIHNTNHQRVTRYRVTHSRDGQSWDHVTGADSMSEEFTGNSIDQSYDHQVTARFGTVLRTRFLRILPTDWKGHCSMRFEVLGCQNLTV
ncbi:lactadherin-like [Patiria miniata]|uniref:F5/8 type C domain-containing protein n=1 Tax=Patiria miniata TaxID=46514 RepID=A0A914AR21_PATMI|nr:lactadherin-like [Patiria miniata]